MGKPSFSWTADAYKSLRAALKRSSFFPASTMLFSVLVLVTLISKAECYFAEEKFPEESKMQPPTVVIAIIARNTAHSLPYYLGALERLNYPKDRISVWLVSPACSRLAALYPSKGQNPSNALRKRAVCIQLLFQLTG